MKFCSLLFCAAILYSDGIDLDEWKKLLHNKNNRNLVKSNSFYVTNNANSSPLDELNQTLVYLNKDFGLEVACAFPARYLHLKSSNAKIPNYNLKECKELTKFVNGFQKEKVSLVFTSEYTNVPSSAFGHIMLLFHDSNGSYMTGDTVHFAAETAQDSFFKYSYNGLSGNYNGYFVREPFFKKVHEYNALEQRYLYLYTLDFNQEEILMLIYHLHELKKAKFKYYFSDGNCASFISDILEVIRSNKKESSHLYYLPIDTIKDFKHQIVTRHKFIPLINKINLLFLKMSPKQQEDFLNIIENNSTPSAGLDDIVKEALIYYYTFYFRKFHISYKNYNSIMNLKYRETKILDSTGEPLERTQPSNFRIAYKSTESKSNLIVGYRPFYVDINDIQSNEMQESEFMFLDFNVLFNNEKHELDSLNILSIKAFNVSNSFYSPMSWQLYSGFNRKNFKGHLKINNEVGIGTTKTIFNKINIGLLVNIGLDDWEMYVKPSLYMYLYPAKNSKIKVESNYKKYFNNYYYENSIASINKFNNYIFSISINNSKIENNVIFEMKYNF